MSRHRTFRIMVTKPEDLFIDIIARDKAHAVERAEALWHRGERSRFEQLFPCNQPQFEIDEQACLHQGDAQNDDRSEWAESALRAFSAKTGSGIGEEGLHDLIADLGHYAERQRIDFLDCIARAIGCWALERRGPLCADGVPPVIIQVGEGGEP